MKAIFITYGFIRAVGNRKEYWGLGKINSKRKGKNGELELSHKLQEYGYNTRRTNQFCGNTGEASDVVGLYGIHCEVKRVEKLNIYDALSQAIHDSAESGKGELPTVFHRKNRCEWLVTMKLDDWIKLYREWDFGNKLR